MPALLAYKGGNLLGMLFYLAHDLLLILHLSKFSSTSVTCQALFLLLTQTFFVLANFVRLGDEFGNDFFAVDVESFLVE